MKKIMDKSLKEKFALKKTTHGLGLVTKIPLKRDTFIVEYTGEKITQEEGDRRGGRYLMVYDKKYMIDGKGRENLGRYVNHSCKPNCKTYMENKKIRVYTIKNVAAGEELTYNYGKEYCDAYCKPCLCGACLQKK